jgi:hypothetical protein
MSVNYLASGDYLDAGDVAAVNSLTQLSICAWVKATTDTDPGSGNQQILRKRNSAFTQGWMITRNLLTGANPKSFEFNAGWSTGTGVWRTPSSSLLINTLNFVCATYDAGSTANNPLLYINGASKTVSKISSPAGTWASNSGNPLWIATQITTNFWTGPIEEIRIYSGILSATTILAMYNSPSLENYDANLKFHAPLLYAANRYPTIPFAGTLGGTDYLYDRIGGVQITPHGAPAGAASIVYPSSGF